MAYLNIINLGDANSKCGCFAVPPGANKAAIMIQAATWATAVVELKWCTEPDSPPNPDYARPAFVSYPTAVQFDTDTTAIANISVTGRPFLRLDVTTAGSGATANAQVYVSFL